MVSQHDKRKYWLGGKREAAQDRFFLEALDPDVWTEGDASNWDTCWYTGMPEKAAFRKLNATRTMNHIPGNNGLTIKSNLYRTLFDMHERMVAQEGESSDAARRLRFFPRVYSMPGEYHALQRAALDAPEKHWILKPKNAARGKGISVLEDVALAPLDSSSMVQEYVGNPHTMWGHKYVLRLYAVITSVEPLRVYLYNEGSAKLASAPYDPDHFDNIYAHLTNPDINATNTESESPVVFRSLASYRQWLREEGHDDERLFARLRDMVALTAIGVRERMRKRLAEIPADTSGCYEMLGFDCLVDAELKPWILECNLSPSLEVCAAPKDGGDVEEQMKRHLVSDMVALLNLNGKRAESNAGTDPADAIRATADAELARAGDYTRVYPTDTPEDYLPFFPLPRQADLVLADHAAGRPVSRPLVQPHRVEELIGEGKLGLYCERDGTLYTPNDTAAWIWLQATEGVAPDAIADALLEAHRQAGQDADDWAVRTQVWDVLADSAASGLLLQHSGTRPDAAQPSSAPVDAGSATPAEATTLELPVAGHAFRIKLPDAVVAARVMPLLPTHGTHAEAVETLSVLRSGRGYAIADANGIQTDGLRLARLAPTLLQMLLRRSLPNDDALAVDGTLVPLGDVADGSDRPLAILIVGESSALAGTAGVLVGAALGKPCQGGVHLDPSTTSVRPLNLPVTVCKEKSPPAITEGPTGAIHQLDSGQEVLMQPGDISLNAPVCSVAAVLVARHRKTQQPDSEPLAHLDPITALSTLLPVLHGHNGGPPTGKQMGLLADWLGNIGPMAMDMSDGEVVKQAVARWRHDDRRTLAGTP